MKTLSICVGLLWAISAHAAFIERAALVGRHLNRTFGDALLICEYSGARARFEILSQNGKCAPYINVQ